MIETADNGLKRQLGLFSVTNIVIANMIGAGIFTTSGLLMGGLNNPILMLILWVVGGIIALCGALCYGELGASIPSAGGEYIYLSSLFHPLAGFLSGWISFFVGFSAPIAASALGFSEYFTRAFPQLIEWGNPIILKKLYAVFVIVVFTVIHIRGIEFGAKVQNYLTFLKVVLIVGLVALGFFSGRGDFDHLFQGADFNFNFRGYKVIGLSLMWIMFAYSGWNASAYIGSEIKNPQRNLPYSLIFGTGIVLFLYVCLNMLYVYALAPEKMNGVISIGGLAMENLFGSSMQNIFSVLISFALFSSLSAFIILGPRVYFSMARDGYFFKFASDVHPVFRVPAKSILLQCGIAIIVVLSGTFDQILTYMGFSLGIFPILAVIGVIKLRYANQSALKMPGYPFVPIIYLIPSVLILILSFLERPIESSGAIVTVLMGIPVFFAFRRARAAGI